MVRQHGDFVASSMLQWKGDYDDRRLGRWTRADLAEYLLDYFPRKVSVDEETLAAVPSACARSWDSSTVAAVSPGEPLEQLEQGCEALRDEFRARYSSQWGLAKGDGHADARRRVDPSAPGAFDAWMADFKTGPRVQRDVIVRPGADRITHGAGLRPVAGPHAT